MRALGPLMLGLLAWFWASAAIAACAGQNLLADLALSDPKAHQALFRRAHDVENGRGRFWRVERAGTAPSHLFGTFHSTEAAGVVPEAVWRTLDQARIALFELSLAEQEAMNRRMASDPTFAFDLAGPALSQRLEPATLAVLHAALEVRGIAPSSAEHMRPWLLFSLLALPACQLQVLSSGGLPLDATMAHRAERRSIETDGLETYEQALAAFDAVAPELLFAMLAQSGATMHREEDLWRTMSDLYGAGEISAVTEVGIWLSEREGSIADSRAVNAAVMKELLDVRNHAWFPRVEAEVAKGGAFVAVGALHLPGRKGLIEMLRARGYTVSPLE